MFKKYTDASIVPPSSKAPPPPSFEQISELVMYVSNKPTPEFGCVSTESCVFVNLKAK